MNIYQRKFHIDKLADEVGYIGQNFERFGGLFLHLVLRVPINAQGINLQGFPVAGVVDGVTPDGRTAAEYSAQRNYFDSPMSKASDDVRHILRKAPNATEIYLLSAMRRRPQIAQDFAAHMSAQQEMMNRTLHLLGAEEIATAIVDEAFLNDEAIRHLAPYLPTLQRLADEEAATGLVPATNQRRLQRPAIDVELKRRLGENRCVVISGLAGIGKSDTAAAFADSQRNFYQNIIWLEGRDIARIEDLKAATISKVGELRNVIALLNSRRCLLIIDDAQQALLADELGALCGPGSHVLLTRRITSATDFELPMFDRADARVLLERGARTSCPEEIFDTIWTTVGGHPLSLGLMNASVVEGASWLEIGDDCRGIGKLESDNQILADRLLTRLRRPLVDELAIFEWAGQSTCDRGFFIAASTPSGLRKLKTHGLTAADRPSLVRLHDVVFTSLAAQEWWTPGRHAEIADSLEKYLARTALGTDLIFWAAAVNLRHVIRRLVADGDRRPAFLYALLSIWSPSEIEPMLIGDPIADAKLLRQSPIAVPSISTMALIEAIEKLFLFDKLQSHDVARDQLATRMGVFDELANIPLLTDKQVAEIKHHKAKALIRLRRHSEAIILFEEVLAGSSPLPESRIQLMRLLGRGDKGEKSKATDIADQILSAPQAEGGVSHSVFLAAVEQLPWRSSGELIFKHQIAIETLIVEAANLGISQAFRTLASIARFLSKEAPDLLNRILDALPARTLSSDDGQGDRATWGDILLEASRTAGDSSAKMQAEALLFFEEELAADSFHKQRHAELLLLMGRARDAKSMLLLRADLHIASFPQRLMALAELQLENPDQALLWIDRALANLTNRRFDVEFYEHRFDIRQALNDTAATEDLQKAIACSDPGNTQIRLQKKLAIMKKD